MPWLYQKRKKWAFNTTSLPCFDKKQNLRSYKWAYPPWGDASLVTKRRLIKMSQVFYTKSCFENFCKIHSKTSMLKSQRVTPTIVLSYTFYEVFSNNFFAKNLGATWFYNRMHESCWIPPGLLHVFIKHYHCEYLFQDYLMYLSSIGIYLLIL